MGLLKILRDVYRIKLDEFEIDLATKSQDLVLLPDESG